MSISQPAFVWVTIQVLTRDAAATNTVKFPNTKKWSHQCMHRRKKVIKNKIKKYNVEKKE